MQVDLILKDGICLLPHLEDSEAVIEEPVDIAIKDGFIFQNRLLDRA